GKVFKHFRRCLLHALLLVPNPHVRACIFPGQVLQVTDPRMLAEGLRIVVHVAFRPDVVAGLQHFAEAFVGAREHHALHPFGSAAALRKRRGGIGFLEPVKLVEVHGWSGQCAGTKEGKPGTWTAFAWISRVPCRQTAPAAAQGSIRVLPYFAPRVYEEQNLWEKALAAVERGERCMLLLVVE